MGDLRWVLSEDEIDADLYDGTRAVAFILATGKRFKYAILFTQSAPCPVKTLEEAKRFVEAQYILLRGE